MTDLTKEEDKHVVDPTDSLSAESSSRKVPDVETLESELSLTNTGVRLETGGWRQRRQQSNWRLNPPGLKLLAAL